MMRKFGTDAMAARERESEIRMREGVEAVLTFEMIVSFNFWNDRKWCIYVCMYVCTYVMHAFISMYVDVCIGMYACIEARFETCHTRFFVYMYAHMHVSM